MRTLSCLFGALAAVVVGSFAFDAKAANCDWNGADVFTETRLEAYRQQLPRSATLKVVDKDLVLRVRPRGFVLMFR